MKLIYVAGPYRDRRGSHYIHENIEQARQVAACWWQRGWGVICPHLNTAHFDGLVPDGQFLEADLEMVRRVDAVVMVPGWERSEGARGEMDLAMQLGIPVYFHERDAG